jgi:hypothetical protein
MQTNEDQKQNNPLSAIPKVPQQDTPKDNQQELYQGQKEEPKSLIRKIDERVKTKVIKYIFI